MADYEKESTPGNDKPEVKEDIKTDKIDINKDSVETTSPDKPEEEEKAQKKTDKIQIDDKSPKKEKEEKVSKKVEKKQTDDKKPKKEKVSKKKEETEENDDEEEDEDDDEEELPPGLLERPLEVEGKREIKKVERLSATMITPQEKKKLEIEQGSGEQLGDIPFVEHQLNSTKAVDLKHLHRVLFLRAGSNNEVKKNIKQFSGFTHDKNSKDHEKRLAILNKLHMTELKAICIVLGLERGGSKVNLVDRIVEFLMKPKDKGQSVKTKKKKKSTSPSTKKRGTKRKATKTGKKKSKADKETDNSPDISDEEDEVEEEEEEEEEDEQDEEEPENEDSEDEPPKKKQKPENKKTPQKKSAKENGKKEKLAPKKETKKPPQKKKPVLDDSLSEDSDDEPIAKIKKSPPTNEEIKDLVKKILDGADLEKVTMKIVVKQVYAKYPSFDLSDRKDFIKDTVREVIT